MKKFLSVFCPTFTHNLINIQPKTEIIKKPCQSIKRGRGSKSTGAVVNLTPFGTRHQEQNVLRVTGIVASRHSLVTSCEQVVLTACSREKLVDSSRWRVRLATLEQRKWQGVRLQQRSTQRAAAQARLGRHHVDDVTIDCDGSMTQARSLLIGQCHK